MSSPKEVFLHFLVLAFPSLTFPEHPVDFLRFTLVGFHASFSTKLDPCLFCISLTWHIMDTPEYLPSLLSRRDTEVQGNSSATVTK